MLGKNESINSIKTPLMYFTLLDSDICNAGIMSPYVRNNPIKMELCVG